MASYVGRAQGVNVLLVEHDINHLISTKQMLEFFSHKVKCMQHASAALSVLSNGNDQFDLVMANISSPDSCTFKLLQTAIKMGLEVILMCEYDDEMVARTALEQGALLFLCKPIKTENVKYLWQHVWREKTRKIAHKEQFGDPYNVTTHNIMSHGIRVEEEIPVENVATRCNGDDKSKHNSTNNVKKEKVWIEWTRELHDKFVGAIVQLGEGKCYPQDILDLMNVPGLTRLQVASHLQKCRSGTWRPHEEGKRQYHRRAVESSKDDATKGKRKRFGCMPTFYEHIE